MQPEEGDFINLELCIGYRGREGAMERGGNAHLLIEFMTLAGLTIPTWISLTSLLLTARVRLQLTPNPPFFAVATLSLTGSPHIEFSCTPLAKRRFLNLMDVPGLAGWVQDSVREALSAFVAPRSMEMNVVEMLGMGGGVDVDGKGVLYLRIGRAWGLRDGDGLKVWKRNGILNGLKSKEQKKELRDDENGEGEKGGGEKGEEGKGDVYVTVGWGKWGKRLWASRWVSFPTFWRARR